MVILAIESFFRLRDWLLICFVSRLLLVCVFSASYFCDLLFVFSPRIGGVITWGGF